MGSAKLLTVDPEDQLAGAVPGDGGDTSAHAPVRALVIVNCGPTKSVPVLAALGPQVSACGTGGIALSVGTELAKGLPLAEPEALPLPEMSLPVKLHPAEKVIVVSLLPIVALPLASGPDVAVNVRPDSVPETVPPPLPDGPPKVPYSLLVRLDV